MIRLTKFTDYGILMLAHISGQENGNIITARELTEDTGLPGPMVSKILKQLAKSGIIHSHRGAKGGYNLAKPAEEISVAAVIEALEGPIGMTACTTNSGSCKHEPACVVRGNWDRISRAITEALENVSLPEMLAPPEQQSDLISVLSEPI
jgi:FeS assembly SUF system regulator